MELTTEQVVDTTKVQLNELIIYIRDTYRDMGDRPLTGVEKIQECCIIKNPPQHDLQFTKLET